jgi:choline dehydrogenase-like flavoprotein
MMRENLRKERHEAEVVVVGTGPGGATSAHILAEHGKEVLLLEDGPDLPLESCSPFSLEEMVQKYRAGGLNPAFGNAKLAFVEARTVGGGSEINSGLYHRTPPEILERWRDDFEVRESLENDLLPHFEYCEHALGVGTYPGLAPLASRKLEEGAKALGWRAYEVPRWFKYNRATGLDGCANGTRQSMTKTFLPRALQAGARLLSETYAHRLVRSKNGWKISVIQKGKPIEVRAQTVFICGGAVQTPLLLRRSGITRNVGNSLAMHPTAKVVALFNEEVNHAALGVAVHQVKEFSPRISFGGSVSSRPHLALALSDYPELGRKIDAQWRHMAVYYAMITGPHTGTIRSVFGLRDPLIRYSLSARDLQDLGTALRNLTRLLLAAGATTVFPSMPGIRPIGGEDELSNIPNVLPASRSNLMTVHLFSSCPMGEDRARCATNSFGQLHGTTGLMVNDASLIPTAPGVNPQGSVMALARRNALHFLGKL